MLPIRTTPKTLVRFLTLSILFAICLLARPLPARADIRTGFQVINGQGYYYTEEGIKYTGWLTLNGRRYYFNRNGVQRLGWTEDGKRYFFETPGEAGYMASGLAADKEGNIRYFSKSSGLIIKGWVSVNGRARYFRQSDGRMVTGILKLNGVYYWLKPSSILSLAGARQEGVFRRTSEGRYYYDAGTGANHTGWLTIGTTTYYCDSKGKLVSGIQKIDDGYYYFSPSGVLIKSGKLATIQGDTYYIRSTDGRFYTGIHTIGDSDYYFGTDGKMAKNRTISYLGTDYYADGKGVLTVVTNSEFDYEVRTASNGSRYVYAHSKNGRSYYLAEEFLTHKGVADGTASDVDILAALAECEAGDHGLIGMEAVLLCVMNRSIKPDREFPSELRYVIYQTLYPGGAAQYAVVDHYAMERRLNDGFYYNKTLAYQAARGALSIFNDHLTNGTPRRLPGIEVDDFNFMYFMTVDTFWKMNLSFDRINYYEFKVYNQQNRDHMFFDDWL